LFTLIAQAAEATEDRNRAIDWISND